MKQIFELAASTMRNIGLGIFVNGAYAWQFSDSPEKALWAIFEGIFVMLFAGYAEIRSRK